MPFVKINGNPNLVRDTKSMLISNTDMSQREEYFNKVRMVKLQDHKINKVNEELSELKKDVMEIKVLLAKLLEIRQ